MFTTNMISAETPTDAAAFVEIQIPLGTVHYDCETRRLSVPAKMRSLPTVPWEQALDLAYAILELVDHHTLVTE